ncbi:MAG: hypothetical protein A2W80_17605 [Candidatus Riflebacteria bacterium GWC2_50_8]|nr:MAG: hypothetical protein A2W80_17605 [Candidatus Riflebacteria bacterium GWC2_50_8]
MKKIKAVAFAAVVMFGSMVSAQEPSGAPVNLEKTPWLKGVELSPYPTDLTPTLPLAIFLENGEAIPATVTEDIPLVMVADTAIFDNNPPTHANDQEIPNPRWDASTAVSWYFVDWEKNQNFNASVTQGLAANQMVVIPTTPTGKGSVTCHMARRLRYDAPEPGRSKVSYANSSGARDVRVLDITPPLCGLEINVENGKSGSFWPVEFPADKYPLPKTANVYFGGGLFDAVDREIIVEGLELGANMIVSAEQVAVNVAADAKLAIRVIGGDNYKLDNAKLKFGICTVAGGEPIPIGPINEETIELSNLEIPENPYIFIDASDTTGNRQVMFVPLKVK